MSAIHFDAGNHLSLCGRGSWLTNEVTKKATAVTCKACLKALAKQKAGE